MQNRLPAEHKVEEVTDCLPLPTELKLMAFGYSTHPNKKTEPQFADLLFFGEPHLDISHTLGNVIFHGGEEKDIEKILATIHENPQLLDEVITVKDQWGIPRTGTCIELAAMAGDLNHRDNIVDEKELGLVERFQKAGNVSPERMAEKLQCITSKDAIKENDERIKRYVEIMKKFGKSICNGKVPIEAAIAQLEKDLQEERSKEIKLGLIFDPRILDETTKWFQENVEKSFGGWESAKSNVFWIHGIGKLQKDMLLNRDKQIARAGLTPVVQKGKIPKRLLTNSKNNPSGLGESTYLSGYGEAKYEAWLCNPDSFRDWVNVVESKFNSVSTFVQKAEQSVPLKICSLLKYMRSW